MFDYILSKKQSEAWEYLEDPEVNELFFGGGAGSGKTDLISIFEIMGATRYKGTYGLIARNQFSDLRDSTLLNFQRMLAKFRYKAGKDYKYNSQEHIVYWTNGSMTFFRDLFYYPSDPDFQSLGSTEYTRVSIDEAPEITPKAKDVVNSRIRYKLSEYGLTAKLLLTGNPGDHWIKEHYVFDKKDEPVKLESHQKVVLATLEDNPDKEFTRNYRQQLERMSSDYDKRRLLFGDWLAKPRSGMEYFDKFSLKFHVKQKAFNPAIPLHITWDFNVNPYMTLLVAQIYQTAIGWEVYFLKEYCLAHPFNTTKSCCQAFLRDIETGLFRGFAASVFYYGDYSGGNKHTSSMDAEIKNDYDVIRLILQRFLHNKSNRVLPNPSHDKARNFMNDIFAGSLPISVFISPDMFTTKRDLLNLKQGPDGGMLKEYTVDEITKARYEKYGHAAQSLYYLIVSAFQSHFQNYGKRKV